MSIKPILLYPLLLIAIAIIAFISINIGIASAGFTRKKASQISFKDIESLIIEARDGTHINALEKYGIEVDRKVYLFSLNKIDNVYDIIYDDSAIAFGSKGIGYFFIVKNRKIAHGGILKLAEASIDEVLKQR